MLTISPQYSLTKTNYNKSITRKTNDIKFRNTPPSFDFFDQIGYYENYQIINRNNNIDINKRPITRKSTKKELENVYSNYKQSLNEISKEDIENTVNNIKESTQYSKDEILNAMQKSTQFGNMDTLQVVAKSMNDNNVGILMGGKNPISRYGLGLNSSLNYLLDQKRLCKLNSTEYAVFLDNNKLEQLELINKTNPEKFNEYKNLGIKYFILSGFDKGVNFIDRSKDLKTITLNTLKEPNINKESIERAKKLGLDPIIIENKQEATIENIYNQLKPNQIDKKQLEAVIDANIMFRFSDQEQQEKSKKLLVKYLDKNLEIHTPESLSKTSKNMYKKILSTLHKQGNTIDDSIFLISNMKKSPAIINHQFQLVNNIPRNKFVTIEKLEKNYDSNYKDKTIIILDDAAISGISLINLSEKIRLNYPKNNIILAPLYASETAKENINFEIEKNKRLDKEILLSTNNNNNKKITEDPDNLLSFALGNTGFENSDYCILFPYMCPDNNSEFANNLGLLHHTNYNKDKLDEPQRFISIKNITNDNIEIAKLAEKLLEEESK